MGRMSVWGEKKKRPNGMKSSAVIKCSGQRRARARACPWCALGGLLR